MFKAMGKVISLESLKNQKAAQRGFREWRRLFKSPAMLDEHTRWSDLPDELILFLAEDDEEGRAIINDLVMGSLDLGKGFEFESLPPEKLLPLLDVYFLLIDHIRFECMRRLGWIQEVPSADQSIITMIRKFDHAVYPSLSGFPKLTPKHPGFPEYCRLTDIDQRVYIRKAIPEAVKQFKEKVKTEANSFN